MPLLCDEVEISVLQCGFCRLGLRWKSLCHAAAEHTLCRIDPGGDVKARISAYTGSAGKHAHMPGSLTDQLLGSTCEKDTAMVDDDETVAHRLYI